MKAGVLFAGLHFTVKIFCFIVVILTGYNAGFFKYYVCNLKYSGILYLSSNICKITQTLYSDCYKIALLMIMSTIEYHIKNKHKVFFNLQGFVWNGQLIEEISIQ